MTTYPFPHFLWGHTQKASMTRKCQSAPDRKPSRAELIAARQAAHTVGPHGLLLKSYPARVAHDALPWITADTSLIGASVLIAAIAMLFTTRYPPGLLIWQSESTDGATGYWFMWR